MTEENQNPTGASGAPGRDVPADPDPAGSPAGGPTPGEQPNTAAGAGEAAGLAGESVEPGPPTEADREDSAITVQTGAADEEGTARPYWQLVGTDPRQEIVYVDDLAQIRFPDSPFYVYPDETQRTRLLAGHTVYADEQFQASEAAVAKAAEVGVDIASVEGTGRNGAVKVEDVVEHARRAGSTLAPVEVSEAEEAEGRAFWELTEGGRVVYADGKGHYLYPGDRGYEAPADEKLAELGRGARVYADGTSRGAS